jgi:hypothetical protein
MPRKDKLTGPDYLVAIADTAASRDDEVGFYSAAFRDMVMDSFVPLLDAPLLREAIASRPLKPFEAAAAGTVVAAAQAAVKNKDWRSLDEALTVGVLMVAKWDSYLIARDMHPDLERRDDS